MICFNTSLHVLSAEALFISLASSWSDSKMSLTVQTYCRWELCCEKEKNILSIFCYLQISGGLNIMAALLCIFKLHTIHLYFMIIIKYVIICNISGHLFTNLERKRQFKKWYAMYSDMFCITLLTFRVTAMHTLCVISKVVQVAPTPSIDEDLTVHWGGVVEVSFDYR